MTSSSSSSSPPTSSSPGDRADGHDGPVCDVRGEVCPFTFVRAKLALEALPIGATLRILVDHEPAVANMPRSARAWGQEVLGVQLLGPAEPAEDRPAGGVRPAPAPSPVWAIDLRKRVR